MKQLAATLVLALLGPAAKAQVLVEYAKPVKLRHLQGVVIDRSGATIEHARVDLRDPKDHHILASTFADTNGHFYFADRKRGDQLDLFVTRNGFNPSEYHIRIALVGKGRIHVRLVVAA